MLHPNTGKGISRADRTSVVGKVFFFHKDTKTPLCLPSWPHLTPITFQTPPHPSAINIWGWVLAVPRVRLDTLHTGAPQILPDLQDTVRSSLRSLWVRIEHEPAWLTSAYRGPAVCVKPLGSAHLSSENLLSTCLCSFLLFGVMSQVLHVNFNWKGLRGHRCWEIS